MNAKILLVAFVSLASFARASLDDILAPLPPPAAVEAAQPAEEPAAKAKRPMSAKPAAVETPIGAADLQEAISIALEERFHPAGRLSLAPIRDLVDLSSYSQPFNVRIVAAPDRLTRGSALVRFQVENEEGALGEWTGAFRIQVLREVWCSKGALRRGELASPSELEMREVDLLIEPDAVPAEIDSLYSREYSRDVAPGRPLAWSDLVQRSLVRKGSTVEVVAKNGLLSITMRAVARQDGTAGDLIVLRNLDSSKDFSARVVGEGRAEAIF